MLQVLKLPWHDRDNQAIWGTSVAATTVVQKGQIRSQSKEPIVH